jgi:hypothetical protein
MQALADHLPRRGQGRVVPPPADAAAADPLAHLAAGLPTFAVHAARRQVTSSAKRAARPGADPADPAALAQTPEGAHADAAANGVDLLAACGVALPPSATAPGPRSPAGTPACVAFHWHPALGPLWEVIAQKVRGGRLGPGSELVLDVAEAALTGLRLDGSLLVTADAPLGHWEESPDGAADPSPRLVYSPRCGRVRLAGVTVTNAGVDWAHPASQAWSRRLVRREAAAITLHGQSEFEAAGVVLSGDLSFVVPHGYRLTVTADGASPDGLRRTLTRLPRSGCGGRAPTWEWAAAWGEGGAVRLEMKEGGAGRAGAGAPHAAAAAAFVHECAGDLGPLLPVLDPAQGPVQLAPGDWVI